MGLVLCVGLFFVCLAAMASCSIETHAALEHYFVHG